MLIFSFFALYGMLAKAGVPSGTIHASVLTSEYEDPTLTRIPNTDFEPVSSTHDGNNVIANAFDGKDDTYWQSDSSISNTNKPYIEIIFDSTQNLESMLYYPYITTTDGSKSYLGFPQKFNINASVGNSTYQLKYEVSTSIPTEVSSQPILIQFPRTLWCDQLKLEFIEVNTGNPACQELSFFKVLNPSYTHLTIQKAAIDTTEMEKYKIKFEECHVDASGHHKYEHEHYGNKGNEDLFKLTIQTHWACDKPNEANYKNFVNYKFNSIECLDGIFFEGGYTTLPDYQHPENRTHFGFPYVMNIYTKDLMTKKTELKFVHTGMPPMFVPLYDTNHIQFPKGLWTNELKVEFEEVLYNRDFGIGDYTPEAKFMIVARKTELSPRLEYQSEEAYEQKDLTISGTTFDGIKGAEFGGAVYLANCALECSSTTFTNCDSTIAGGGIYLKISKSDFTNNNPATFNGLTFTDCKSGYGGAICVIAKREQYTTSIVGCTFNSNIAENQEHGGSALFLYTNKAKVQRCTFTGSSGRSTIIRYATSDPSEEPTTATILSTDFEFEVRDCIFEDQHQDSTFYINIDESIQQSPHILLTNNQLSNSAQLSKTTFKDQHHNEATTQTNNNNNRTNNRNIFLMILIPSLVVISLLFLLIIYRHHNDNQENSQETNNNA